MKKISVVQGDTSKIYKFTRKDAEGNVITTLPLKMWMTFKETTKCGKALFQRTMGDGIAFSHDDNCYRFQLQPEDTENLGYGEYAFDIKIVNEKGDKKTILEDGVLEIKDHCTHKQNEV